MQPHPAFPVRRAFALVTLVSLLGLPELLWSAAPPNDVCSAAILVPASGPFPYLSPVVDVTDATTVGDPPLPPPSTFFDTNVTHSVWFRFVPAVTANYTLSVGEDTATTILDTSMAIYTSTTGCSGATNLYMFNEDSGLLQSAIYANFTGNRDYYIVVWVGGVEAATNNLFLQLRVSKPGVPVNDTCAGAEVIPGSGPFPYETLVTDTTLATDDPNLSATCAPADPDRLPSRDVWYRFTPGVSDTYLFSTRDNKSTVEDTLLALYTSSGACAGPFTEVICNDNSTGRGVFARTLTGGTTYYLLVWDNSIEFIPGETLVQLRVLRAPAPSVTTQPASSIASTGAVLNATLNANGLQTRFWFEWGPTSGLGSTSQLKLIIANSPNSTTTIDTNLTVSGLSPFSPNTLYRYRFVATNSAGASRGDELTFVWSNTPPQMIFPQRVGNSFNFEFFGNPGQLYVIQATTNFATWQTLGHATNLGTLFQYTHRSAVDLNRGFRVWAP